VAEDAITDKIWASEKQAHGIGDERGRTAAFEKKLEHPILGATLVLYSADQI